MESMKLMRSLNMLSLGKCCLTLCELWQGVRWGRWTGGAQEVCRQRPDRWLGGSVNLRRAVRGVTVHGATDHGVTVHGATAHSRWSSLTTVPLASF